MNQVPLVVDLDGTLLDSDLLIETAFAFVRQQPKQIFSMFSWLWQGKACLKRQLASSAAIDVTCLPYDPYVLQWLSQEKLLGRRLILATASDVSLASAVANHLALFDEVIATEQINLAGKAKAHVLVERFGLHGFDYIGNSKDDLPVFATARQAFLVNGSSYTKKLASRLPNVIQPSNQASSFWTYWLRAMRIHQWVKNLLIFVPLLAAHRFSEIPLLFDAVIVFICFSLCASSVYLLNDLFDLQDDRHHHVKKARPIAAGLLPLPQVLCAIPMLLVAAFGTVYWLLPAAALVALAAYYVLTLFYSVWLKRLVMFDVLTLATLYTNRLVVGAVALAIPMSFWLLAFSMFMFLSLALLKRYAELMALRLHRRVAKARGRGYVADDLHMIASLGAASGYMAVMVLALYVNDKRISELYQQPQFIWLACPLLLGWISKVWMLAHRGQMNEDPVIFALRDRFSQVVTLLLFCVFGAAL